MCFAHLNGERRQKTGILAMLCPKTEDPLFGQQRCGYSQETVLAQERIYQHYQCQLHSIAFSFLAECICVFGGGEKARGRQNLAVISFHLCNVLFSI